MKEDCDQTMNEVGFTTTKNAIRKGFKESVLMFDLITDKVTCTMLPHAGKNK